MQNQFRGKIMIKMTFRLKIGLVLIEISKLKVGQIFDITTFQINF